MNITLQALSLVGKAELCEPKMVPTCVVNPLKSLGVLMSYHYFQKYKKSEVWCGFKFRP